MPELFKRVMDVELRLRTRSGPVLVARIRDVGGPADVFGLEEYDFPSVGWPRVRFVVDIGAHIGSFSVWAVSSYRCRAVAVEPNPEAFALLQRNVGQFGGDVRCIQAALAAAPGVRTLVLGEDSAGTSLDPRTASGPVKTIEVEAITLAQAIEMAAFPQVDVLKVDIEGAEHEIFMNLDAGLLDAVQTVLVECHKRPGRSSDGIVEALAREGFTTSLTPKSDDLDLVVAVRTPRTV